VPIATGERLSTKHEFARVLDCGAAAILQPALGRVGGILEAKKIAAMAETRYAEIAPHLYCGPVEALANIQLGACIPNFLILESIERFEGFHADLLTRPIRWEDGYVIPTDAPGLGADLNEDLARAHPYEGDALHLGMRRPLADCRRGEQETPHALRLHRPRQSRRPSGRQPVAGGLRRHRDRSGPRAPSACSPRAPTGPTRPRRRSRAPTPRSPACPRPPSPRRAAPGAARDESGRRLDRDVHGRAGRRAALRGEAPRGASAFLECPVTGGVHLAAAGEITVLVGGDEPFARHRPALEAMGGKVLHMGPLGSAALIKVITNMLAFIHLVADGEALMLAKRGGPRPRQGVGGDRDVLGLVLRA
jgi:hypothetical protein